MLLGVRVLHSLLIVTELHRKSSSHPVAFVLAANNILSFGIKMLSQCNEIFKYCVLHFSNDMVKAPFVSNGRNIAITDSF